MFNFFKSASSGYQNLTPTQFAQGLGQPNVVLLDVRRPDEFSQGHLPNAVNVDVSAPDFARRVAALNPAHPTFLYCRSGARSGQAASMLVKAGFENVHNLMGGVLDWPKPLTKR
jgi:phage shock protein E